MPDEVDHPDYHTFQTEVAQAGYVASFAPQRLCPYVEVNTRRDLLSLLRATTVDVTWAERWNHSYTVYPTA